MYIRTMRGEGAGNSVGLASPSASESNPKRRHHLRESWPWCLCRPGRPPFEKGEHDFLSPVRPRVPGHRRP
jgi:hypothetical protein